MNQQLTSPAVKPLSKLPLLSDFSSKPLFVGIDMHKLNWQVAVLYQGVVLSNTSIHGSADKLIHHLHKLYPHALFHCVYEAGCWGFTLCRELWAAGMNCIVVNPADIPTTNKDTRAKTDQVDARKLAQHHSAGLLLPIHVPSEALQKQRSLIRFRKKLWKDLVRSKNRLKSQLCFQGISIPPQFDNPHWSRNFLQWIREQAHHDELLSDTLLLMLEQVIALRALMLQVEKKLRELMRSAAFKSRSELLLSIPGVGPLTAMLFLLEVGDVSRFKSFDELNRFVGFCPDSHSSGSTERQTGLSTRGHSQLRSQLVEAAWQLIRKDMAMLEDYKLLCKRMDGQHAIIRIARRLLRRMRAVLVSAKPYLKGISGAVRADDIEVPAPPAVVVAPKVKGRPRRSESLATAGLRGAD